MQAEQAPHGGHRNNLSYQVAPSAGVTVAGAAGNQSSGPRSWQGARPWVDPKAGTTQVGGIHSEVAGARAGERVGG